MTTGSAIAAEDGRIGQDENVRGRLDPEVAKYAGVDDGLSESEDKRLKRLIDKRVLLVMVVTYFLQTLDKGTLSFASIMNLRSDLGLVGQQVS